MNEYAILAFVVMPVLAVAMGYVAVRLQERQAARFREQEGEWK